MRTSRPICIALMLLAGVSVNAQQAETRCTAEQIKKVELRGLRLGMTLDQVTALYPSRPDREDEVGRMEMRIFVSSDYPALKGIKFIRLGFLDKEVTSIEIDYDASVKWPSAEQFISKLNESLKLPNAWVNSGRSDNAKQMECEGYMMRVVVPELYLQYNQGPRVFIDNFNVEAVVKKRTEALEEKKRETFKP